MGEEEDPAARGLSAPLPPLICSSTSSAVLEPVGSLLRDPPSSVAPEACALPLALPPERLCLLPLLAVREPPAEAAAAVAQEEEEGVWRSAMASRSQLSQRQLPCTTPGKLPLRVRRS